MRSGLTPSWALCAGLEPSYLVHRVQGARACCPVRLAEVKVCLVVGDAAAVWDVSSRLDDESPSAPSGGLLGLFEEECRYRGAGQLPEVS